MTLVIEGMQKGSLLFLSKIAKQVEASRFEINKVWLKHDGTALATDGKVIAMCKDHHKPWDIDPENLIHEYLGIQYESQFFNASITTMMYHPNMSQVHTKKIANADMVSSPNLPRMSAVIPRNIIIEDEPAIHPVYVLDYALDVLKQYIANSEQKIYWRKTSYANLIYLNGCYSNWVIMAMAPYYPDEFLSVDLHNISDFN